MQEIEVKLGFDPNNADTSKTILTDLFGQPSQKKHLKNTYFDTPTKDLRKIGWSLRVRDKEGVFEQTAKGKGTVRSGLHQRLEVNQPIEQSSPDISKLAEITGIQPFLTEIEPAFNTDFLRMSWEVKAKNSIFELALDEGVIGAKGEFRNISEIEIELSSGATADLFAVAEKIAANIPCWLYSDSKAKRGYELLGEGEDLSLSNSVCTSFSDWVSIAGSFAQQLTVKEAPGKACFDQLKFLLDELIKLTTICSAELKDVKHAAEQLTYAFKTALANQADSVSVASLRQLVNSSTYLGTLGVLVVKAEFQ